MNAVTWQPSLVTLVTGEQVLSDSEAWRAECDARYWWPRLDSADRVDAIARLTKKRGTDGCQYLLATISSIEPHLVLAMPSRDVRRAYAARVEARGGQQARLDLEARVRAIWEARRTEPGKEAA